MFLLLVFFRNVTGNKVCAEIKIKHKLVSFCIHFHHETTKSLRLSKTLQRLASVETHKHFLVEKLSFYDTAPSLTRFKCSAGPNLQHLRKTKIMIDVEKEILQPADVASAV